MKKIKDAWYWDGDIRSLRHLHATSESLHGVHCYEYEFAGQLLYSCPHCEEVAPDDVRDVVLLAGGVSKDYNLKNIQAKRLIEMEKQKAEYETMKKEKRKVGLVKRYTKSNL